MADKVKRAGPPRLISTLGLAGLFSGLILVTVYLSTRPLILENQAAALEAAIYEVVPGATTRKVFVVEDAKLVPFENEGAGLPTENAVYAAYDESGKLLGYAVPAEGAGFQDTIRLLYGYDPERKVVTGMEVLESKETPGLGDKIMKDPAFLESFEALEVEPEIKAVPQRSASNEVDSISGATISSKAVVNIINQANRFYLPIIASAESGKSQ